MSRHTRLLAPLSMAALFSLGLAAGQPAAQQAERPRPRRRSPSPHRRRRPGANRPPSWRSGERSARRSCTARRSSPGCRARRSRPRGTTASNRSTRGAADRPRRPGGRALGGPVEGSNGAEPVPRRRGRRRLPRGLHAPRARSRLHRPDDPPGRPPRRQAALRSRGPAPGDRARREETCAGSARRSASWSAGRDEGYCAVSGRSLPVSPPSPRRHSARRSAPSRPPSVGCAIALARSSERRPPAPWTRPPRPMWTTRSASCSWR